MEWINCKNVEELKESYLKLTNLRKVINDYFEGDILITFSSWETAMKKIKRLRGLNSNLEENYLFIHNEDSLYFKDEISKYIYILLELDGGTRLDKLGIKKNFYKKSGKEKAKAWRNKIIKKIHPDKCKHPRVQDATNIINKLYEGMVK